MVFKGRTDHRDSCMYVCEACLCRKHHPVCMYVCMYVYVHMYMRMHMKVCLCVNVFTWVHGT